MDYEPDSVAVVLGTRPEIVKLAGVITILGPAAHIIHTGQHYDRTLTDIFFEQLGLPAADVHLAVGGVSRGRQIGEAVAALDEHFEVNRPRVVVVQGDTNTTCAAAIAANAREIPIVHIEAGLRSFDRAMPEEHNRVLTDHLGDVLCAPTETSRSNLLSEGIPEERIAVTGNTVVGAVERMIPKKNERREILARMGLQPNAFVLSTFHRPENVDNRDSLSVILEELARLSVPVVLPLHPRSAKRAHDFGLDHLLAELSVVEPTGFREFIGLAAESAFVVSDSGGIQEEASVLKRSVIVVRRSTERPEVIGTFAERVLPGPGIGEVAARWLDDLEGLHERLAGLPSPYGNGSASQLSVDALGRLLSSS